MMRILWRIFVIALIGTVLRAEEINSQRPQGADGGATKVYVAMGLLDVDEIDSAEQNFTANLFVSIRWQDDRLKHDGPGVLVRPLSSVWHPDLIFVNQQKIWPTMKEIVHVSPSGVVEYNQRIWGPFSQPLDVHDFPFDTQSFEMRMAAVGVVMGDVAFEADPDAPSGLADKFSLPDWEILNWKLDFSAYRPVGSRRGSPGFAMVFTARRYVWYYLLKIILPLIFIVVMSWVVFWIDPKASGTQIGVATTSMLTLIAYRFMVGGTMPAVPYLTRMDRFIMGATILVFLALVQSVITSMMANRDRLRGARNFDYFCRFIFPIGLVIVAYLSLAR